MGRKPCMGSLVHRTGVAKLLVSRVPSESGRPTAHRASGPDTASLSLTALIRQPAIGDSVLQRTGDSVFAMRLHGRPRAVESRRRHQGDD